MIELYDILPLFLFPNCREYIFLKIRIVFHVVRVTERSIGQGSKFVYFWAENMDYAVCITAKYGRKTVFSFVRAASFNSSFQDIFKERGWFSKRSRYRIYSGIGCVSTGPNGPWHTVDSDTLCGLYSVYSVHPLTELFLVNILNMFWCSIYLNSTPSVHPYVKN